MKHYLYAVFFLIIFSGCAILRGTKANTASQNAIIKEERKALDLDKELQNNLNQQIKNTAVYAYGISYSLNQIQDPSVEVVTASKLNDRVVSIVGSPEIKESERIRKIVDYLNSEIVAERSRGEKLLLYKDKEIVNLQKQKIELEKKYDAQVNKLIDKAKQEAKKSDEKQTTLDSMNGFLGLNAVFWGLKRFFFTSLTWIAIFVIVFFILRVLSATNPIAAAVFSIFNVIGSLAIDLFKGLTPNALQLSKLVTTSDQLKYKVTLTKIVDVIQIFKEKQNDFPDRQYTLKEILNKFEAEMDRSEKDLIDQILREEKWRK